MDANIPTFSTTDLPQFTSEDLDKIREKLGVTEVPSDDVTPVIEQPPQPIKRRRGRPRKYPISQTGTTVKGLTDETLEAETKATASLPPAKLTKRSEREVSERFTNIFTGATGVAATVKPYLQMTDEEAKAIAEPLSSYLIRNEETIAIAQSVLENYDLLAIIIGIMAYTVRVYNDRLNEISEQKRTGNQPQSATLARIQQLTEANNNGQGEGSVDKFRASYVERSGLDTGV